MAETNSDYVGQIFNLANAFAVPFVQKIAGTDKQTAQQQANNSLQEIADNARLNGSGPNDPALAVQTAPTSIFDFINGKSAGATKTAGGSGGMMFYLLIALGVVAMFLAFRR